MVEVLKKPISEYINPIIKQIRMVKSSEPVANDIVKATRSIEGKIPTYNQAYKVLAKNNETDRFMSMESYQLVIPYLEEFRKRNLESTVLYERDDNKSLTKIFLCPSIMNNKLRFVRPIMSLDAAHLSSELKGTLYLATVKSGNDEILPIAIGMTTDNENFLGWKYFLNNLKTSCPVLTINHRLQKCKPYKLFTFISDRDKGLIPALQEVFPNNHHTNCLFHIRANVIQNYGLKIGNLVQNLGTTFSIRREEKLFHDIEKLSTKAYDYVTKINPKLWRNTEWLKNDQLPPRYGIVTSNNAETANSMFKMARSCSWLYAMDKMLHIIMLKIADLRLVYKDKKGLIPGCERNMRKLYETCANYNITLINEEQNTYKVYMGVGNDYNHHKTHEINLREKTCTCGYWQDSELVCVHVMTYYRIIEDKSLLEILAMPFCHYYSYQYLNKFYKDNINPVIIEVLQSDHETKPPMINKKRQPGRPITKRMRKRSKSDNTIMCSNCGETGHNKKTCKKPIGYLLNKKQLSTINDSDEEIIDNATSSSANAITNIISNSENNINDERVNIRDEKTFY